MAENLKAQSRDAYRNFVREALETDVGTLQDNQRSWALTLFYLKEIHSKLRTFIDDDDIEFGHVDGSDDCGVDFIHRDDGVVLIIQSKYHKQGADVEAKEISYFQGVLQRLCDPAVKKNKKLAEAVSDIDFENDRFVLRFHALAKISGQADLQAKEKLPLPQFKGIEDRLTFECLQESDLTEEYRQALSTLSGIPGEHELFPVGKGKSKTKIIELQHGGYRSCILVISANQLINLYNFKGVRDGIFSLNIRNFIGRTATNKAIAETAKNNSQQFFYFNNGISALATSLDILDDRVKTTGLQIINGAQTLKSLVRVKGAAQWSQDNEPLVMLRIIEIAKGYSGEGKFRNDVIRYNNTQNIIKLSDFRSNDLIQKDLVEKFRKVARFGKHVQYVNKRTDIIDTNCTSIRMEEFAKVVYSFLLDPVSFSANSSFLFDESEEGGYKFVFGDGRAAWESMPEDEFKLRSSVWWMSQAFAERLKQDRKVATDPKHRAALERQWMVLFVSRLVLERSFGDDAYKKHLIKTYRGEWKLGEDGLGKWFADIYEKAKQSLTYVYVEATKKTDFNHRNWMRNKDTVRDLKDFVLLTPFSAVPSPQSFQ